MEITHWQRAIHNLRDIVNRFGVFGNPEPICRIRESRGDPNGQFSFEIVYQHPKLGARSDELIIFNDGTWRMKVW